MEARLQDTRRKLDNAFKRLLRKETVPGGVKDKENLESVCICFNEFYAIVTDFQHSFKVHRQSRISAKFILDTNLLVRCGKKFNVNFHIPTSYDDKTYLTDINCTDENKDINDDFKLGEINSDSEEYSSFTSDNNAEESDMNAQDLIKTGSALIKSFNGDPIQLRSFVNNVKLVKSLCPVDLLPTLVLFVKGRLEGKALTFVDDNATTIEDIITKLTDKIQPDSSSVLEAKLAAIRFDNKNLTTFSAEIEKVSDMLTLTFINEGIPCDKANDMTVQKVVETCRKSARSDLVKSVLASSSFKTPKDVVSKFVTEIADQNKDKQFLAYQVQARGNTRWRGGYKPRGSSNNGQFSQRGRGHFNHNYHSNYQPNSYQSQSYLNNNNRGGGYGRGTGRGGHQSVRTITTSENCQESPRWETNEQ